MKPFSKPPFGTMLGLLLAVTTVLSVETVPCRVVSVDCIVEMLPPCVETVDCKVLICPACVLDVLCSVLICPPWVETVDWSVLIEPCALVIEDWSVLIDPPCVDTVVLSDEKLVLSVESALAWVTIDALELPGE